MHDKVERIESVKAGSLGGVAAGISYGLILMFEQLILAEHSRSLISFGLEASIVILTGFLFGVTYRYVIRTDRNDHLNSGAVLAFGLVRGLAQLNITAFDLDQVWLAGLVVGKSILLFAIARYAIDYALKQCWLSPFKSSELLS
jgi:hypothetical protein